MNRSLLFYIVLILLSCKKPYNPTVVANSVNFLVVEGMINIGGMESNIRLSRTTNLQDLKSKPESGAEVTIENESNTTYSMMDFGGGNYRFFGNLTADVRYRLRIKTKAGATYLSDFVEYKLTKPIDQINAEIKPNGLLITLNSQDDTNNSTYYRFEYDETWQFQSRYESQLIVKNGSIINRNALENIYNCFGNSSSSAITIASTAKLSKDILYKSPITFIKSTDEKISIRYSILVRQYAISEQEYNFWETLKKNTENVGSIFDPQPSFVSGNIKCVSNPSEKALGYIGAGSFTEQRIFVDKSNLPQEWKKEDPFKCELDSIPVSNIDLFLNNPNYTPVYSLTDAGKNIIAYYGSNIKCVDCTTRGTKQKPIFWQ
jgi:hypothetical protein